MPWPAEQIPDDDDLYRIVHREKVRADGGIRLSAFTNNRGAMSVDWSKYSTPEETRQRALLSGGACPDRSRRDGVCGERRGEVTHSHAQVANTSPYQSERSTVGARKCRAAARRTREKAQSFTSHGRRLGIRRIATQLHVTGKDSSYLPASTRSASVERTAGRTSGSTRPPNATRQRKASTFQDDASGCP